jgi:predicted Zn-dependent protease with MMP-like domain
MSHWHPTPREFAVIVEEALDGLPDQFSELLENIVVLVEEEPSEEDLEALDEGDDPDSELLGIFRGLPLTERSWSEVAALPDQVAIFRGPILRVAGSRAEAIEEIQETVIHELGHFFGLDDEEMPY